jgi:serine/threonine protein kinase
MSLSIDKDLGEQGENARAVLASWLDDYIAGRCDRADMQAQFLSVCRSNPDAPWDALALLDQYQRRGRIDMALARSLKTDIAQLVFGVANQTETKSDGGPNQDTTDVTIDTTGSRWRTLMADRDPASINSEPAFVDPSLLRRDLDEPVTRPPPSLKLHEEEPPVRELREPKVEARADARIEPKFESRVEPKLEPSFNSSRDPSRVDARLDRVEESPAPEIRTQPTPARERPVRAAAIAPVGVSSDVLRDRYELISVLGRGSTGTVYKAVDRHRAHLDAASRCVAVKVLKLNYQDRPDELAQLEREFHEAQSLSHPNVVSVFDLDRDGNVYFIVMELLEGELLADILKRLDGKPMARHYALGIISSVGAALAHAHQRGVVHADLKPRNIMITTAGEVRVLDFGFARERPLDLHTAPGLHDAPTAAPAYASVERVNGSEPHPSDDVYSLACVAYEMLSGKHPFGGRSAPLARAHGRPPQKIPGLSGKQQQVLQRALLWTRGERRIDIIELLAGLGGSETSGRLGIPEEIITSQGSGSRGRAAFFVTLLMLLGAGVYFVFQYGLLPKNIASVLPISPPFGDRELQSEVAVNPAPVEQQLPTEEVTQEKLPLAKTQQSPAETSKPGSPPQVTPPQPQVELPQAAPTPSPQTKQQQTTASRSQNGQRAQSSAAPAASQGSASSRPITIEFDKDSYVTTEGEGYVRLQVRRTGSLRREVSFTWNLRQNSAEAGSDFAGIGPGTERIPAGVREFTITIPLVQDAVKESTELFLVELQVNEDGVSLGERSSAAVIIVDDD